MVRLRFVLDKNRCVQSFAEVPPIFGMVTLACMRDGSQVQSRRSMERKESGKLKLLPGYAVLHRVEGVGEFYRLRFAYILRVENRETSLWVAAAVVAM